MRVIVLALATAWAPRVQCTSRSSSSLRWSWDSQSSARLLCRRSEGWLLDCSVGAGIGWRPPNAASDLFGAGVGWTRPAGPFPDGQTTGEVFYRFHVTPNFAITPDLQVIVNPSLNPSLNTLWAVGLRARIAF